MTDPYQATEKNPLNIQDWLVWAKINYLDSPTDYREFLPSDSIQVLANGSELVMLDDTRHSPGAKRRVPPLVIGIICCFVSVVLLYVLLNVT